MSPHSLFASLIFPPHCASSYLYYSPCSFTVSTFFIFLLSLFTLHFQFLSLFLYFSSPSPRFLFLFTASSLFCFSSSSVFLTLVSYLLIVRFLHLLILPLLYFLLLLFLFLRSFATVNFGCSYPCATLNLLKPKTYIMYQQL